MENKNEKNRQVSKNYIKTKNFVALLGRGFKEEVKGWQHIEPHHTDLIYEQLQVRKKLDYYESLANHVHTNVKRFFLAAFPFLVAIFGLLCLVPGDTWKSLQDDNIWLFRALVIAPIAFSFANIPLFIFSKKIFHDLSYKRIRSRIGLTIFKYFEPAMRDEAIDGGYTKKEIVAFLKRKRPKMPYTEDQVASYLRNIVEVEMDRKPRGYVYYVQLKAKYLDKKEKETLAKSN